MPRFKIKSAMNTGYLLAVDGGILASGTQIIFASEGQNDGNSVWQIGADGVIACAADPGLVLMPGESVTDGSTGYGLVLAQREPGDASQQWIVQKLQGYGDASVVTIQNKQNGQYINTNNSTPTHFQSGEQAVTWPNDPPTLDEYWALEDVEIRPTAVYLQCGSSGNLNSGNPFVLDLKALDNTDTDYVYSAVVNPWVPGAPSQAWRLNSDGTITNMQVPLLALTATGDDMDVQVAPLTSSSNPLQQWIYVGNGPNFTVNISGSTSDPKFDYLNVDGGGQPSVGNQVITYKSNSGSNNDWLLFNYAMTVPGAPVTLQVSSNGQLYALAVAQGQSGAGASIVLQAIDQGEVDSNQLWCIYPNGAVLCFLDPSLALTYSAQGNQPVTLQAYDPTNAQQQWWVQGPATDNPWQQPPPGSTLTDIVLAARVGSWSQYLDASGGYQDQAPLSTSSKSIQWTMTPYEPPAHPGQWFTIRSGQVLPGEGTPSLLTVGTGGELTSSPPLGVIVGAEATAAINQLWRLTMEGMLVCAINPGLVLTANGDTLTLSVNTGDAGQQWQWGYAGSTGLRALGDSVPLPWGALQNLGSGTPVLVSAGASSTGNAVTVAAMQGTGSGDSPGNYPAQLWYVTPHLPAFDQPTRLAVVQPGATGSLILALQNDQFAPGTPVVVVDSTAMSGTATWQFSDTGQIVNVVNPQAVLSLAGGNSGSQDVVVYPLQPGNQPFQCWGMTPEGLIYNLANMQALTVTVAGGTATLATAAAVDDGAANGIYQRWDVSPSPALMTVLMQPPVPFPVAAEGSDEAAAYVYINAMLGLQPAVQGITRDNALRQQYANLSAPLSSYQRKLGTLKCPPEIGATAWASVVDQLDAELTAAIAVQALFVQMSTFHMMFSQAQSMALPSLVTAVELSETDSVTVRKKHAWIWDMCIGLVNTALNVAGTMTGEKWAENFAKEEMAKAVGVLAVKYGAPALGNLLNTSLSVTQAVLQSHQGNVQRDINFEMTVLQLQQKLLQTFQTVGMALGQIQAMIFQDWGRLRAVYEMTTLTQSGASLYWPSVLAPTLVEQLLPGYVNSVLQTLMPNSKVCQTIYRISEDRSQSSPAGLQSNLVTYVDLNPDGTQTTYTLGQSTPNAQMTNLMTMVWNNGINAFEFFHAQGGWSQMIIKEGSSKHTGKGNPFIVAYVQNFTPQAVSISLSYPGSNPEGEQWGPVDPVPLLPYGVATFASASTDRSGNPVQGYVQITDSSGNVMASGYFHCDGTSHDWRCVIGAGTGYSVTSGYQGVVDDMVSWNIGLYAD